MALISSFIISANPIFEITIQCLIRVVMSENCDKKGNLLILLFKNCAKKCSVKIIHYIN